MLGYIPGIAAPRSIVRALLESRRSQDPLHVVEVGGGTGAWAIDLCAAVPTLRMTVVDLDPLLCEIGSRAYGDADGRVERRSGDLRRTGWSDGIRPAEALISCAALHVVGLDATRATYAEASELVGSGGLVATIDWAAEAPDDVVTPVLESLQRRHLAVGGATDFRIHADALRADPLLRSLDDERRRRLGRPAREEPPYPTMTDHANAMHEAGFTHVATPWRHLDLALIVGVRR
jgi:hypothetical protein